MNGRRRAAFTLLELIAVIAITAVLSGLVAAGVQSAHSKAASVQCMSNLRQWAAALALYEQEHDGAIPRRGQGVQPVTQIDRPDDWFNALPTYMNQASYSALAAAGQKPKAGEKSVFVCPLAKNTGAPNFFAYAMNMYLSDWAHDQQSLQQIPHPEITVFMADGPGGYSSAVPSALPYSVQARHGGRANLVFLDGHVESYSGTYLGCGEGEQPHGDVQWQTGTGQAPYP